MAGRQTVRVSTGDSSATFDVAVVASPMASIAIDGAMEMPRGKTTRCDAVAQLLGTSEYCSSNAYEARTNVVQKNGGPHPSSVSPA